MRRCLLRVRIRDQDEAAAFRRFLELRTEVVATKAYPRLALANGEESAEELELAVVASLSEEAMRLEVELLVRAWQAARRAEGKDATIEVV